MDEEISPLFKVHRLNEGGMKNARLIAEEFNLLLDRLETIIGTGSPNREFAIVKTKLEEACFFAKKAMANDPANQQIGS